MDFITANDEVYMQRALQLASNGEGTVAPNPMVGAVIVADGKIIGEGFHRKCGEAHAEVNAIRSVRDKKALKQSTIYVSLEPCAHYGKTPPCCNLIIDSEIPRVVIGCLDPFPEVSGKGVEILRGAGIDVRTKVLEDKCLFINRKFITCHTKKRPYIMLKWCESSDGFIAGEKDGKPYQTTLSNPVSLIWMHRERSRYDAVMVGTDTVINDNPSLTVRHWEGRSPVRVTIDRNGRIPSSSRIFADEGEYILFTDKKHSSISTHKIEEIDFSDEIIPQILTNLYKKGITSLMIEGGQKILQGFIDSGTWDEVRKEVSSVTLKQGVKAPLFTQQFSRSTICGGNKIFYAYKNTENQIIK
ncbi:MAG: bifunctional diaminohydroxyphosphoribosylaminopyrimidine deaminase/5-amino-6-(5-phosphoribosylamino)uracil reductase RibD [Bacteroidales bacterium]